MSNKFMERRASRSAVESVIADAIAVFMPEADAGQDGMVNLDRADSILTALVDAGYRVTRNPT
jgi:hypothetical protein